MNEITAKINKVNARILGVSVFLGVEVIEALNLQNSDSITFSISVDQEKVILTRVEEKMRGNQPAPAIRSNRIMGANCLNSFVGE